MKKFDWQAYIDKNGIKVLSSLPDGWAFLNGAANCPNGYDWASNQRSRFSGDYKHALIERYNAGRTLRSATAG